MQTLRQYKPLGLILRTLCDSAVETRRRAAREARARGIGGGGGGGIGGGGIGGIGGGIGGDADDGAPQLTCSRSTARRHLNRMQSSRWVRWTSHPLGMHVWGTASFAMALSWLKAAVFTLPTHVFLHVPACYICANLLRHVDTPLTPLRTIAVLTAFSSTPFFVLEEALELASIAAQSVRHYWRDGAPLAKSERPSAASSEEEEGGDEKNQEEEGAGEEGGGGRRGRRGEEESRTGAGGGKSHGGVGDGIGAGGEAEAAATGGGGSERVRQLEEERERLLQLVEEQLLKAAQEAAKAAEEAAAALAEGTGGTSGDGVDGEGSSSSYSSSSYTSSSSSSYTSSDDRTPPPARAFPNLALPGHLLPTSDAAKLLSVDVSSGGILGITLTNIARPSGVRVLSLKPEGLCAAAGLRAGDVIVNVNGFPARDHRLAMAVLESTANPLKISYLSAEDAKRAAEEEEAAAEEEKTVDKAAAAEEEAAEQTAKEEEAAKEEEEAAEKAEKAAKAEKGELGEVTVGEESSSGASRAQEGVRSEASGALQGEPFGSGAGEGAAEAAAEGGFASASYLGENEGGSSSSSSSSESWHEFGRRWLFTALRWLERAIYAAQDATRLRLGLHISFVCYLNARMREKEREAHLRQQVPRHRRGVVHGSAAAAATGAAQTAAGAARTAAAAEGTATTAAPTPLPTTTPTSPADQASLEDEPVCRICFGGSEMGQLVSPCLCSGSMRFVHLDCLTRWRTMSTNPMSHMQCEQCLYKYSFRRAMYASVLRSALVLHVITLLLLGLVLLLFALLAQWADRRYLGGVMRQYTALFTPNELTYASSKGALGGSSSFFSHYFGVDGSYLLASFTVIGISGFLSLGMLGPMLWPGRGQHDTMLLIMIVVGVVRTFTLLYNIVKKRSGYLLREAEKMIVDVGDPAPDFVAPAAAADGDDDGGAMGEGGGGGGGGGGGLMGGGGAPHHQNPRPVLGEGEDNGEADAGARGGPRRAGLFGGGGGGGRGGLGGGGGGGGVALGDGADGADLNHAAAAAEAAEAAAAIAAVAAAEAAAAGRPIDPADWAAIQRAVHVEQQLRLGQRRNWLTGLFRGLVWQRRGGNDAGARGAVVDARDELAAPVRAEAHGPHAAEDLREAAGGPPAEFVPGAAGAGEEAAAAGAEAVEATEVEGLRRRQTSPVRRRAAATQGGGGRAEESDVDPFDM